MRDPLAAVLLLVLFFIAGPTSCVLFFNGLMRLGAVVFLIALACLAGAIACAEPKEDER